MRVMVIAVCVAALACSILCHALVISIEHFEYVMSLRVSEAEPSPVLKIYAPPSNLVPSLRNDDLQFRKLVEKKVVTSGDVDTPFIVVDFASFFIAKHRSKFLSPDTIQVVLPQSLDNSKVLCFVNKLLSPSDFDSDALLVNIARKLGWKLKIEADTDVGAMLIKQVLVASGVPPVLTDSMVTQSKDGQVVGLYATLDHIKNVVSKMDSPSTRVVPYFDSIDIHLLNVMIPLARVEVVDFSSIIRTSKNVRFPYQHCVAFDMVIACSNAFVPPAFKDHLSLLEEVFRTRAAKNTMQLVIEQRKKDYHGMKYPRKVIPVVARDTKESLRKYVCYGDPYTTNPALCDSGRDEVGVLRKFPTTWDRPCEVDAECPFQSSIRGGCRDGYCELPVGVVRKSYRKSFPIPGPACRGCPSMTNPFCCGDLSKPLAFELDLFKV